MVLVGGDVRVVEALCPFAHTQAAQCLRVAAHRDDAAHLEEREVPYEGTRRRRCNPRKVTRLSVVRVIPWQAVDVRAGAVVQAELVQHAGEEVGVDVGHSPVPVLASLDLDQRGLDRPIRRGSAHVWASASFSWYADRWMANSRNCSREPSVAMNDESDRALGAVASSTSAARTSGGDRSRRHGTHEVDQAILEGVLEPVPLTDEARSPTPTHSFTPGSPR